MAPRSRKPRYGKPRAGKPRARLFGGSWCQYRPRKSRKLPQGAEILGAERLAFLEGARAGKKNIKKAPKANAAESLI